MRKFLLEKLVYDEIVEFNMNIGAIVDYRILEDDQEFIRSLHDKLDEEFAELLQAETDEERHKEVEDMRAVLYAIRKALGYEQLGTDYLPVKTFDKRHYISSVTVPDGEWADYYAADPVRFPEIT